MGPAPPLEAQSSWIRSIQRFRSSLIAGVIIGVTGTSMGAVYRTEGNDIVAYIARVVMMLTMLTMLTTMLTMLACRQRGTHMGTVLYIVLQSHAA